MTLQELKELVLEIDTAKIKYQNDMHVTIADEDLEIGMYKYCTPLALVFDGITQLEYNYYAVSLLEVTDTLSST